MLDNQRKENRRYKTTLTFLILFSISLLLLAIGIPFNSYLNSKKALESCQEKVRVLEAK